MKRPILHIFALLPAFIAFGTAMGDSDPVPDEKPEIRVFFVGNSYTQFHKLPKIITALGASAEPPVRFVTDQHTPGGCNLEWHWKQGEAMQKVEAQKWDWVVLQEQSMRPVVNFPDMAKYARLLCEAIRKTGARPAFYMTWARAHRPEMTEALRTSYRKVAEENNAKLVPVGLAWSRALKKKPDLRLHQGDNSHPNVKGSYLTACVFYAFFTGQSPEGLTHANLDIPPGEVAFLQQVAWDTVESMIKQPKGSGVAAGNLRK